MSDINTIPDAIPSWDERTCLTKDGWRAYFAGDAACPYIEYSSQYSWWMDGWLDARQGDISTSPQGMFPEE